VDKQEIREQEEVVKPIWGAAAPAPQIGRVEPVPLHRAVL
jgi:hypothetical protein